MPSSNLANEMVTVEFTTGDSRDYVLVAMDNEAEWAVGLDDTEGGELTKEVIRKGNIVTISPVEGGLVGAIRYMWASEKQRAQDDDEYTREANSTLNWLKDRR